MNEYRRLIRRRMANTGETEAQARKAIEKLEKPDGEPRLFWLSFWNPENPRGERILGMCIVRARGFVEAVRIAHALEINPGGQVEGNEISAEVGPHIEASYLHRLLTSAECTELSHHVAKALSS